MSQQSLKVAVIEKVASVLSMSASVSYSYISLNTVGLVMIVFDSTLCTYELKQMNRDK